MVVLKQRAGTPRFEAVGTVGAERVLDVLVLLALFFATARSSPQRTGSAALLARRRWASSCSPYSSSPSPSTDSVRRGCSCAPSRLPGISRERTQAGRREPRRRILTLPAAPHRRAGHGLTVVSWLLIALSFWILLLFRPRRRLRGGDARHRCDEPRPCRPFGPAAVGVFEAATVVALAVFGVDHATALSYGIVVHALNALPFIPAGYIALRYHAGRGSPRRMAGGRRGARFIT